MSDSLVFPAFNLHINGTEVTAIYSSLNVRSTLLQMLTKEIPVVMGEIFIRNIEMSKVNLSEVGFSFLEEGLYERLTVEEHLKLYCRLYNCNESIPSVLRKVHLEEKRNMRVKQLSYSEQKRILFGKLLIQNPELFIFEEPDQNVDFETQRIFMLIIEQLRNEGKSLLILTSNMESAITTANRVFKLDEHGLQEIQVASESEKKESEDQQSDEIAQEEIQPVRFEKIPTKVNEKIVLFDPPEIDYIESND
ncbi:ATP-binding cassette domain-containing protein, partial [Microvirga sp. 3-52]|nr:ATP-binding cassette domain-containing protein [Microvirga sp. 3-52]